MSWFPCFHWMNWSSMLHVIGTVVTLRNPAENPTHQPCSTFFPPRPICFEWLYAAGGKVMTVFLFPRHPWWDLMALGGCSASRDAVALRSNQRLDQSALSIDSVALLTQRWRKKNWDIFHLDFTAFALHAGFFHCSGSSLYCQCERTSSCCVRVRLSPNHWLFHFVFFTSALRQSVEFVWGGEAASFTVCVGNCWTVTTWFPRLVPLGFMVLRRSKTTETTSRDVNSLTNFHQSETFLQYNLPKSNFVQLKLNGLLSAQMWSF